MHRGRGNHNQNIFYEKKTLSAEEKIEKTPRLNENIKSFFLFFIDPICLIKISSKLRSEYSHHTLSSCS